MFYPQCCIYDVKEQDVKFLFDNYLFDEFIIPGDKPEDRLEFSRAVLLNKSSKTLWDRKVRMEKGDMAALHTPNGLVCFQVSKRVATMFSKREYFPKRECKVMRIH